MDVIPNTGGVWPIAADGFYGLRRGQSADAADELNSGGRLPFSVFSMATGALRFVERFSLIGSAAALRQASALGKYGDVFLLDLIGGRWLADIHRSQLIFLRGLREENTRRYDSERKNSGDNASAIKHARYLRWLASSTT